MISARASARGLSEAAYMEGNLLGAEVTPEDDGPEPSFSRRSWKRPPARLFRWMGAMSRRCPVRPYCLGQPSNLPTSATVTFAKLSGMSGVIDPALLRR